MVYSKFSHCHVISLEASWIKKRSSLSVLPGLKKSDRIFCFKCVRFVCVCIAQANKLFSILYVYYAIAGPDLHCVGPPTLWEFHNIFSPNIGEDQKSLAI